MTKKKKTQLSQSKSPSEVKQVEIPPPPSLELFKDLELLKAMMGKEMAPPVITVAILINGHPIVARNAVNQGCTNKQGATKYTTDSGDVVFHHRTEGAVALARKLLDMIRNDESRE